VKLIRSILLLFLVGVIAVRGGYAIHGQITHNTDEFNWGMTHALLGLILLFTISYKVKLRKD
jgi:hydrogenase/urease accessory protein HupE